MLLIGQAGLQRCAVTTALIGERMHESAGLEHAREGDDPRFTHAISPLNPLKWQIPIRQRARVGDILAMLSSE